ncbi:uncharacterized protein LOC143017620 [Oratosquilla oratoria]|uniref:uncharacterized protein LOC143017620 n=1 Tax=Oratosquilla oratoria TaxID=337810 RepID=UPI003F7599AB
MDKYVTSTPRSRNPSAQSDTPRSTNPSGLAESESDASDIQLPEFSSPDLMPGTSRAEDIDIADIEAEQAEGGHGSRRERDLYRDWDILKPFFKCGVGRDAGFALCAKKNCTARLKLQNDTNSNLEKHYATEHPLDSPALKAALDGSSKRGRSASGGGRDAKSHRQGCIEEAMAERFDQQKALDLFYEWINRDMLPTITTESEALRAFLNYLNPQFKLPSRKKLGDNIKHMSDRAKNELTQIMSKQDYLATTADSWSSHNRAFIGSTVSWLDKATLERTTAVLGMKEVKESQTAEYLARSLSKLHEDFSISSKILCTTTDNGTNYVSAFVNFAQEDVVIQPGEDKPDEELADEPQVISMEEALDQADEAEVSLPKHQRCGAHTLNLLASEDVSKVPQWNHGGRNIFRRSAAKAQSLWNAQGRRTLTANEIKDAIGKKLKVPGATRWNSSYDSYKMLSGLLQDLDTRKKINDLCTSMRPNPIPAFVDEDNEVIAEYVKVMAPVTNALDKMQSDQHAYMGNFLPNVMVLQRDLNLLRDDNSIKHAKPLVTYLLGTQEHHGRDKKSFTER